MKKLVRVHKDARYIGGLTKRQIETVGHVCRGLTNKEIADRMHLSESTVKKYVSAVYETLSLRTRFEILNWALASELITPADLLNFSRYMMAVAEDRPHAA